MQHISVKKFLTWSSDTRSLTPASVVTDVGCAIPGTFMKSFAVSRASPSLKVPADFAVLVVYCHE